MPMSRHGVSRKGTGYVVGIVTSSMATAVIALVNHYVLIPNASLLYLLAILSTAVYFGTGPSLVAATVAVTEYDFFLLRPLFTFTIGQVGDILAFVIFLIVAILTSQLAARAKERAEAAQRRATESTMLYELGQALMSAHDVAHVLEAITRQIVSVFGADRCAIFVPDGAGPLRLAAESVRGATRDRASESAARYVYQRGTQVGLPTTDEGDDPRQRVFMPLRAGDRTVGVMEVGPKRSGHGLDTEERRLVTSFAAQASLVIARAESEVERHRLSVIEESDRLKSALLSAVSHDLRTPLASIKASTTALLLADAAWSSDEGLEMLQAIDHEADRLNRLVGNLLDLSRIEAGVLRPELAWYEVDEVMDIVLSRLGPLLEDRRLELQLEAGIPSIQVDLLRIEELLVNLIENAVKYTPLGTGIDLHVERRDDGLRMSVVDHGPGVPESQRTRIFESFVQGQHHSDRGRGTGLGLAICRGIAQVHDGTLTLSETPGGGATFVFTLPAVHLAAPSLPAGERESVPGAEAASMVG